ncbi:MAG: hypothetical protein DDT38_01523 [Firmicutes bacterium]|nr:hypothetical protein [candidate division NPL-UPA2 bacterium]
MQQDVQGNSWRILENYTGLVTIGTLMALAAGTINGVATNAIVFDRVSHLTGRVNNMLRDLWTNPWHGLLVVGIIYIFVLGTFLGGKLLPRLGLTRSLLVPIVPLVLVCILLYVSQVTATPKDMYFPVRYMMAYLLALAMGLQNSVTSQTPLGRTTHFTGDLTDMGLAFAGHKWRQAGYIFSKHLGFACGGFAGFLLSRSLAEYVGIALATGLLVAIVLFAAHLSPARIHP